MKKQKPYCERLKDPRWQKRRLEILEKSEWRCEECSAETKELHVHHLIYRKGRDPWEYEDSELMAVCFECHEKLSRISELISEAFIEGRIICSALSSMRRVLGFLHGEHGRARSSDESYVEGFIAARLILDISLSEYRASEDVKEYGEVPL